MADLENEEMRNSLLDSLNLVFSQSRSLLRDLEEKNKVIEALQTENRRLQQEVTELRIKKPKENENPSTKTQVDHLFKISVQKQAEKESVTIKLENGSTQTEKVLSRTSISSNPTFIEQSNDAVTENQNNDEKGKVLASTIKTECSRQYRKRTRSLSEDNPQPLREISRNRRINKGSRKTYSSKIRDPVAKAIQAIKPYVAEDGEKFGSNIEYNESSDDIVVGTLQSFEDNPHVETFLFNPQTTGPSPPLAQQTNRTSHSKARILRSESMEVPFGNVLQNISSSHRQTLGSSLSMLQQNPLTSSPADKMWRSLSVDRLHQTHFKNNPKADRIHGYSFNDIFQGHKLRKYVQGCDRSECRDNQFKWLTKALDSTFHDCSTTKTFNDELLVEFLGPGSEKKIKSLTNIARMNLLHEARARRLVNMYGKMRHRPCERGQSPPGFWETDMPDSHEGIQTREKAKLR